MIRSLLKISMIAAMLAAGSAAAHADGINLGPKGVIGGLLGGALGGFGGSKICKGDCGKATTAGGAILGMLVGYGIGDSLDNIDRMRAEQATNRALSKAQAGQAITWDNPNSGNSGSTMINRRGQMADGSQCADYTQTIYVQGKPQVASGIACKRPDDTWQIAG